jgi:hypothetical protein
MMLVTLGRSQIKRFRELRPQRQLLVEVIHSGAGYWSVRLCVLFI